METKPAPRQPNNIYKKTIKQPTGKTTLQDTSRQEYADGAILGMEIQEPSSLIRKLQNQEIVTARMQLTIQWKSQSAPQQTKSQDPTSTPYTLQHDGIYK